MLHAYIYLCVCLCVLTWFHFFKLDKDRLKIMNSIFLGVK